MNRREFWFWAVLAFMGSIIDLFWWQYLTNRGVL